MAKSLTLGVQEEISAVAKGSLSQGIAINLDKSNDVNAYFSESVGVGFSAGAGISLELGIWMKKPDNLKGQSILISLGAAVGVGGAVTIVLSLSGNFQGFVVSMSPGGDIEIDASASFCWTQIV